MYSFAFVGDWKRRGERVWVHPFPNNIQNIQSRIQEDMEAAKQKRTTAKAQYTRAEKRLNDALKYTWTDTPMATVERRYQEHKFRWNEVQNAHDEYISHAKPEEEAQVVAEDKWIDDIASRFSKTEIDVDT